MPKRNYFTRELASVGSTGVTVYLYDGKPSKGVEIHYTSIIVRDETSNGAYVTLGRMRGKVFYPAAETQALPAGLDMDMLSKELVIKAEDYLAVAIEGTTTGDDLQVSLTGYTWHNEWMDK